MSTQLRRIKASISADVPMMLWGPPGVGKTATILALADAASARVEVLIGSQLDPTDIGGLPVPTAGGDIVQSPPPWARRIASELEDHKPAWLFLDELSCAPASVQAAMLRLVHDRAAGGLDLTSCRIIAAGNHAEHAADGGWMSPAMASRFAHIDFVVDHNLWISGTLRGWNKAWADAPTRAAAASIAAYLQRNASSLAPATPSVADCRQWPSPRSWTMAIRTVGAAGGPTDPIAENLVADCVGSAAAKEWATWLAATDLPDPEDLLDGTANLPKRGDLALAACLSMTSAAISEHPNRTDRLAAAWRILHRARPDVALVPARVLLDGGGEVPDEAMDLATRIRAAVGGTP